MKITVSVCIAMFVLVGFVTPTALAGGMEGGGGKTVVCRDSGGKIQSAEVLDLYEGRVVHDLQYKESAVPWKEQGEKILEAASVPIALATPPSGIFTWYYYTSRNLTILPVETSLKPIDDSLEVIIPNGCSVEQTVNYLNDRKILVNGEVWAALSETQKAALIIHEAVYRDLRDAGEKDSRRARHLTAHFVAGQKIEDTYPPESGYNLLCRSEGEKESTFFYVVKQPTGSDVQPGKIRLYFAQLGGRKLMSRAYTDLDIEYYEQLKNPSQWTALMQRSLTSLFEPGDTFDIRFNDDDGKWRTQIVGTSVVDGSPIGPVDISCIEIQ